MPLTHICLCMYLEYTCLKWIYHMRSYKYDWLKNIYTCTFISYSYWYTYTFFWFVFIYQKWENKVNQENRFLDIFFFERDWEQENADFIEILSFKLPCFIICDNINWLFIFWRLAWSHAFIILSNFLMALPYVALHIFDPLVDL